MTRTATLPSNGGLMNPKFEYVKKDRSDIRVRFKAMQSAALPANVAPLKRRETAK